MYLAKLLITLFFSGFCDICVIVLFNIYLFGCAESYCNMWNLVSCPSPNLDPALGV